ncbi:MAG: ATP-dependent helicase, partial [Candidatus Tectomicrobia bacterium]
MRSLDDARQQARTCRAALGASTDGLFERIVQYLLERHAIEPHPANARFLDGGRAEVSPAEGCLFYDVRLDDDPAEKLVTLLHELGHLELHTRLQRGCAPPDPVYGSMYLTDGASALARYNRRAREEAEANAFAAEFLCPSREVLQQWRQHPADDSMTIAQRLGVPLAIVQAQLAEALYWLTMGDGSAIQKSAQWRPFTYDASQHEAATFTGRPALVNAGPGTGKTATLVRRIEYLLEARGATPESFLVLTFSNDAAEELRDRIAERFGVELASRIAISTFHGFGVTFLHHHGQFLNIDAEATILDEVGQEDLVTRLLGAVRCDKMVTLHNPEQTVKDIVRHISYLKDRLYDPERFAAELTAWQPSPEEPEAYAAARQFLDVYRAYEMAKADHQHIDFADCIACPIRIFDQNALLIERYREKYAWVLVDEYQDVSRAVAILLQKLCGPNNPPWVVGDAQQAIYRFRGAAPENVTQFDHDFPSARVFNLHTNYRSCTDIVQTANQLAAMMDTSADGDADVAERWRPGTDLTALGEVAVTIARAASDRAEQEGIAAQVAAWRAMGIPAHH